MPSSERGDIVVKHSNTTAGAQRQATVLKPCEHLVWCQWMLWRKATPIDAKLPFERMEVTAN